MTESEIFGAWNVQGNYYVPVPLYKNIVYVIKQINGDTCTI